MSAAQSKQSTPDWLCSEVLVAGKRGKGELIPDIASWCLMLHRAGTMAGGLAFSFSSLSILGGHAQVMVLKLADRAGLVI